jgi:hypothetical protein
VAVIVALVATMIGYIIAIETAPVIEPSGTSTWWFAQDVRRAVETQADGAFQTTVPTRSGQEQGFVITVYNPSDFTQTVLGLPSASYSWIGGPNVQTAVANSLTIQRGGGVFSGPEWMSPGTIPPHQIRALRVLWTSTACLVGGSSSGSDVLTMRVRVGWFTRTEVISLGEGWFLSGPSNGAC